MSEIKLPAAEPEVAPRRIGWFRPFCLAFLVLILIATCAVGGAVVLLVRQVITVPPGLVAVLTGSTPITIQSTTVLDRIQSMSQLTTVRYNYSSIVTSQRDMPAILATLYGDKLVMVAVGHINAGIDLRQVKASNITSQGDTMTLQLPPPQLLDCFLDEQASYVISRDTGLFARPAPNLDQEARRFAVGEFRKQALDNDILSEVQSNAQVVIQNFVTSLGVKKVNVVTTTPDPNAPLPQSCQ